MPLVARTARLALLRTLRAVHRETTGSSPEPRIPSSPGVDAAKASTTEKPAREPSLCRSRRVVGGAGRAEPIPFEVNFRGSGGEAALREGWDEGTTGDVLPEIRAYFKLFEKPRAGSGVPFWCLSKIACTLSPCFSQYHCR